MKLSARSLCKRYGAVVALQDASIELLPGTIHGLVGQNGAGKSTLVRLLARVETPDGGELEMPANGVAMVPQYPRFAPSLTVWQNISIGRELRRGPFLDAGANRARVQRVQTLYDLPFPIDVRTSQLSPAEQRRAAVASALLDQPAVLILDEPTAGLHRDDQVRIVRVVRRVAESGRAVLFISHDLREVTGLCDRVTVLRGGVSVAGFAAPIDTGELAEAMFAGVFVSPRAEREAGASAGGAGASAGGAGASVAPDAFDERGVADATGGAPPLQLRFERLVLDSPRGGTRTAPLDLKIEAGRVAVLVGLREYGIEAIEEYFAGSAPAVSGAAWIGGERLPARLHPRKLRAAGVAYVPSDRVERAATLDGSIEDNMILVKRRSMHYRGVRVAARVRTFVGNSMAGFEIGAPTDTRLGTLSGGTIHRVILSREVGSDPRVCIVSEPSVGIDLRGQVTLRNALRRLAERGAVVLVLTSRTEDAPAMGDHVWAVAPRGVRGPYEPNDHVGISHAMAGIA